MRVARADTLGRVIATPMTAGRASKETILAAAMSLMLESGYEKTSIAMISERAGLPVGSIYHHFGNKASICFAVLERAGRTFWSEFSRDTEPLPDGSPEQRLRWFCDDTVRAVTRNLPYLQLADELFRARQRDPVIEALLIGRSARTRERLTRLLQESLASPGEPFPHDLAGGLAAVIVLFTRGVVTDHGGDEIRTAEAFDQLYLVLSRTVSGPGAREPGRAGTPNAVS